MQSLAMLDAIIEAEWQYRYFSFNARWSQLEQMGSMRDGSGDDLFALFDSHGCFIKGFAHECAMSPYRTKPPAIWPGVLEHVPQAFSASLTEPAFKMSDTTFCIWREPTDSQWRVGPVSFPNAPDPDGSETLLSFYDADPATYQSWASDYYEREFPLSPIQHVFDHGPLNQDLLLALGSARSLDALLAEANEIGYTTGAAA